MSRQYLTAKFAPGDKRAYTYHNDGEPVACGDLVLVPGRGDKPQTVTVHEVFVPAPEFATKAIIGRAPLAEPAEGKLL